MKKLLSTLVIVFVLIFIYAPIVILAVYSFLDTPNIGATGSFTLNNYITLFTTEELSSMIWGTVILALVSAVISTFLGTVGAIGTFYSRRRTQAFVNSVNQVPVVNADVVTGFSICILLVILFGMSKETFFPLIVGHVTMCTPFVYLSVLPKLKQMDQSVYEAALDLGASPAHALNSVVVPQLAGGIISGFMLAVTLSLDDYFIATYTKPATFDTISTYVVNATRGSHTEIKTALWALSTVIFILVVLVVIGMNLFSDNKEGKEMAGKA